MGFFEDLKNGNINNIITVILVFLVFHLYWSKNSIKENMSDPATVEAMIKKIYKADVESIRNLADLSKKLQAGGLTIPGNVTIGGNLKASGTFNYLPRGTIVAWTGTSPPEGWAICNGQNGTPNLQGRFVLGWSAAGGKHGKVPGADYNQMGGSGGNQVHRLSGGEMPAHNHGMDQAGHHQHGFGVGGGGRGGSRGTSEGYNSNGHFNVSVDGAGNHTHRIHNAGGNEDHNNMPPYWVLAYIMKL